jgi:hypothetical protein
LTPEVKDRLSKLKPMLQTAVKDYIQAVKDAETAEIKELTDIGSRSLFKITVPMPSPSNPFAGLWKKLTTESKSYTDSQAAAIIREETKKKVVFIKTIFKSVDLILKELEKLRVKERPSTKGGRRRKVRSGGNPLASETADDQCAELRKKPEFADGNPRYLHDSIKAIAYGSVNAVDGTEWVARKATSATQKSALKYLLDRLNTGAFAETADYLKGVRGKDVTYTLDDVILAGEAYVLLRCYLKKATERVRAFIKDDTVAADIARGMAESAKAREEETSAKSIASANQDTWKGVLREDEKRRESYRSTLLALTTAISREVGKQPARIADKDVLQLFVTTKIPAALDSLRSLGTSPELQSLTSGVDQYETTTTASSETGINSGLTTLDEMMKTREAAYTAKATPIFQQMDTTIKEIATTIQNPIYAGPAKDFSEEIASIAKLPAATNFVMTNPMNTKAARSSNPRTEIEMVATKKAERSDAAPEIPATNPITWADVANDAGVKIFLRRAESGEEATPVLERMFQPGWRYKDTVDELRTLARRDLSQAEDIADIVKHVMMRMDKKVDEAKRAEFLALSRRLTMPLARIPNSIPLPPPEDANRETSAPATSEPGSTGTAPTTPVADAPPAAPGAVSLYQPNPVGDNQILPGDASQRFMLPGTKGRTKLTVRKSPSATVTVRKEGGKKTRRKGGRGSRKSRKSTLKKRRGGK